MTDSTHPDVGTFPTALAESLAFIQGVASRTGTDIPAAVLRYGTVPASLLLRLRTY